MTRERFANGPHGWIRTTTGRFLRPLPPADCATWGLRSNGGSGGTRTHMAVTPRMLSKHVAFHSLHFRWRQVEESNPYLLGTHAFEACSPPSRGTCRRMTEDLNLEARRPQLSMLLHYHYASHPVDREGGIEPPYMGLQPIASAIQPFADDRRWWPARELHPEPLGSKPSASANWASGPCDARAIESGAEGRTRTSMASEKDRVYSAAASTIYTTSASDEYRREDSNLHWQAPQACASADWATTAWSEYRLPSLRCQAAL